MANTLADVISHLLTQSKQVPPRLSESQRNAFHATCSCSIKYGEPFEAPFLLWYSCDLPLPTSRSPKACWLKRARLNQHMLRLVMTPLSLFLLAYKCFIDLGKRMAKQKVYSCFLPRARTQTSASVIVNKSMSNT
ncbi:hypothetical protein GOODEAATRI_029617 [Goodea atripinnis]|uniref:Uncharacterized protein n=1 Tax=Goodea atripinnis TaxID=208336 RepID=A0ABV0MY98_9TELE